LAEISGESILQRIYHQPDPVAPLSVESGVISAHRRAGILALTILAMLVAATASAQFRRLPPGAAILGQVVDADSGESLDRAAVTLRSGTLSRHIQTDREGRFLFAGLPAGEYVLLASRPGYLDGAYGQRRAMADPQVLSLLDGQWARGVDVPLWRPGVITGYVADAHNDPAIGLQVRAYRREWTHGTVDLVEASDAWTDDQGAYRIYPLIPGDYVVGVAAPQLQSGTAFPFLPEYYAGAWSPFASTTVAVDAGRTLTGINFYLREPALRTLTGRLAADIGSELRVGGVGVLLLTPPDPFVTESIAHRLVASTVADADGRFQMRDVPVGTYVLEVTTSATPLVTADVQAAPDSVARTLESPPDDPVDDEPPSIWWGRQLVTLLAGEPDPDVSLVLRPGLAVEGRAPEGLTILFTPVGSAFAAPPARAIADADGRFGTGPMLLPGQYAVTVDGLPVGALLGSIRSGGRDLADEPLDLTLGFAPTDVTVELTRQRTAIIGMVRATGPFGDPAARVLAFPADRLPISPRRLQSARVRTDGSFDLRDLPAGDYLLVAIDDAESAGWQEPFRLDRWRPKAMRVTLLEGDAKVIELRRQSGR
jgi:hypothetical protein